MGLKALLTNLLRDESGATAIEYGLIAALIAVAIGHLRVLRLRCPRAGINPTPE
jgi:hypothetical protein